jgi:hypothetical protein
MAFQILFTMAAAVCGAVTMKNNRKMMRAIHRILLNVTPTPIQFAHTSSVFHTSRARRHVYAAPTPEYRYAA